MYIDKNRKGLVRGVIQISQDHGEYEPIKAYTYWYRHDEPELENKLQSEMDRLLKYYLADHWRCRSALLGVEWMDYKA